MNQVEVNKSMFDVESTKNRLVEDIMYAFVRYCS